MCTIFSSETVEKIIPHVQNLQNEVEGTKAAINKLERKVSKIGQDISAIDRNMREILKHLTNASKSPTLESLGAMTPTTPCPTTSHFDFDFQDSALARERKQRSPSRKLSEAKPNDRDLLHVQTEYSAQTDADNRCAEFNPRRRSSLQVPLLLNPHELVGRRHSDGSKKKNIRNQFQVGMPISKSEYNVRENEGTEFSETDCLLDHSDDFSFTTSDYTESYGNVYEGNIQTDTDRDNVSLTEKSEEGRNFMGRLEEVHSNDCKSPLEPKIFTDVCDNDAICDTADTIRKSSTFDTFKTAPKMALNKDYSMPALKLNLIDKPKHSNKSDIFSNNKIGICLETLQSKRSKSCVEISPKPKRSEFMSKANSYSLLETEFGAKTPNEVRTIHCRTKHDSAKHPIVSVYSSVSGSNVNSNNTTADSKKEAGTYCAPEWFKNDNINKQNTYSSKNELTDNNEQEQDHMNDFNFDNSKTDSGHVSLLDTDSDADKKERTTFERNAFTETDNVVHTSDTCMLTPSPIVNSREKLRRLKPDLSPDSLTDLSESLISDSVKMDDETVIDMDAGTVVINNIFGPLVDEAVLRTTSL